MAPGKRRATGCPGPRRVAPAAPGPPRFLPCPTCGKSFVARILQQHAWNCGETPQQQRQQQQRQGQQQSLQSNNSVVHNKQTDAEGKFVDCPICSRSFPHHAIETHAWGCLPPTQQRENDGHLRSLSAEEEEAAAPAAAANTAPIGAREIETLTEKEHGCVSGKETCASTQANDGVGARQTTASTATSSGDRNAAAQVTVPPTTDMGRGGNVVQRLMEGGKRAVKMEREAKIVPPTWPVESIEDALPRDKADSLLACLLRVSRSWTSHPWFNNNGLEGTTHTRSHVYRIPTAGGSHNISRPDRNHTRQNDAQRYAGSPPTTESQRATESSGSRGCAGTMGGEGEGVTGTESAGETPDGVLKCSGDGEIGRNYFSDSTEGGAFATPRRLRYHSNVHVDAESSESVLQGPAPDAEAEHSNRRATSEEFVSNENSELAPKELLEIVPLIVQVVRRRQRQRLESGLSGREGLNWNPNYCICHVYDDHRSHIGAHSDTLSKIGPQAIVAAVSLGAKRVFVVQEMLPWGIKPSPVGNDTGGGKKFLGMPHNSAIVMWAGCQERYKHSVPAMPKGVGTHPMAGTKRISVTLRERKETFPAYLLPVPDCRCGVPAALKARVLRSGGVEYLYQCDPGRGQCGFMLFKGPSR